MIIVQADRPILIVDDDEVDRLILAKVIERSQLANEVAAFGTGESVLAHLDDVTNNEATRPGLVLLDVNMPGLSGFDVLAAIRSRQELIWVPVVVMVTSSEAEQDKSLARELGANDFLPKQSGIDPFVTALNERFTNN